jgi:hypothetical protein
MNLQQQIAHLRRRYEAGDDSARSALQQILRAYVLLIVRRAARPQNAASRTARGLRRFTGETGHEAPHNRGEGLAAADELCQKLSDELLRGASVYREHERIFETLTSARRTTDWVEEEPAFRGAL